jgi:hypothetical protein
MLPPFAMGTYGNLNGDKNNNKPWMELGYL